MVLTQSIFQGGFFLFKLLASLIEVADLMQSAKMIKANSPCDHKKPRADKKNVFHYVWTYLIQRETTRYQRQGHKNYTQGQKNSRIGR